MASIKVDAKFRTAVGKRFKDLDPIHEFDGLLANEGVGKINQLLRKDFESAPVEADFSVSALVRQGWTQYEAEYLNRGLYEKVKVSPTEFNIDGKNKVIGETVLITGNSFGGRNIFQSTSGLFSKVAGEAKKLLLADLQGAGKVKRAPKVTDKQLEDFAKKQKAGTLTEKDQEMLYKIAYGRFEQIGRSTKSQFTEVHAGHIEGHENFRLAAAGRLALAFRSYGVEKIPKGFLQEVAVAIDTDLETVTKIQNFTIGKVQGAAPLSETFTQKVVMELGFLNISKGDEAKISKKIGAGIFDLFIQWAGRDEVITEIFAARHSPSFIKRVEDFFLTVLTNTTKYRNAGLKSKRKGKPLKFSIEGAESAIKRNASPRKKINFNTAAKGFDLDILQPQVDAFAIRNVINEILAIKVREQMDESTDPPVRLRYQTGRFADSAKLLSLTSDEAGILFGTYTYQRRPYDVFLPSGRLGTAQRDPRIYVESAINEAAISILKKKFPGMQLELQ